MSGTNTYAGNTTISAGTLQLGASGVIPNTSNLILNGGTFSTAGFTEGVFTLSLQDNSTIALGTGAHTLTFSGPGTFTTGKVLTITGWKGVYASNALTKYGQMAGTSTDFVRVTGALGSSTSGGLSQYGQRLTGTVGSAGTDGRIIVNSTILTTAQKDQIKFYNSTDGSYNKTLQITAELVAGDKY